VAQGTVLLLACAAGLAVPFLALMVTNLLARLAAFTAPLGG